jgi:threonine synthase
MTTSLFNAVVCLECGHSMPPNVYTVSCAACGGAWLDARYDSAGLPKDWPAQLAGRPTSMWRYTELLPFPDDFPRVSLGEGWTPLTPAGRLAAELGYGELWIKDERQQPTGSFKDRQAAATTSMLVAEGTRELVLASTGNAAAAYAAFCARAGIKLWVFLTSSVPTEKMRELALYGAEVVKITGTYDQAKEIAADFAARRGILFDRGAKALPGKESMKTIAFEIAEQLGWRAPDWYVQAVSGGIGPLGVLKGFTELHAAGLIDRVPKLAVVQSAGCAPMVEAWRRGADKARAVRPDTLITVLATGDPGYAYEILKAATDTHGGAMVAVGDGDAFRAMRRLARTEGFSVEPAASVAFAGLANLMNEGHIRPDESVVINCSGHTFSAEKHALEDRYVLHLDMVPAGDRDRPEGLVAALRQLDEQVTTVVVIDDNPHDSRLICRLLQRYRNYRVFEAHNGPDGIDLIRQRRPDLVVLDLTLPEMDGFTILTALKSDPRTREIPVMIVSAKTLEPEERAFLASHTASIWEKGSFSAGEMVRHVVTMLGGELDHPDTPLTTTPRQIADGVLEAFGDLDRRRILVVDGNTIDARLLRRLFEARQRFEVIEAHSGAQALDAARRRVPDLVILDLALPDTSGEELLLHLRRQDRMRDVPVIVVSPKDIDPARRALLAAQADSVWSKETLDRSSLLAHVETILT